MSEDLTKQLDSQENGAKLTQILAIVQSLDTRVQSLDTRVGSIDVRLGSLEQKVEQRLYDTRPIWEKVQTDIIKLQEGQEFLRRESHEIHTLLRDLFRRLSIFNDTLTSMQADYRDSYDRVRGIERQGSLSFESPAPRTNLRKFTWN